MRRRIRVKTSDPRMVDDGGGDRVALRLKYLRQVIMDEEETLLEEEEQACQKSMKRVRKLRQEEEALKHQVPENEEDDLPDRGHQGQGEMGGLHQGGNRGVDSGEEGFAKAFP